MKILASTQLSLAAMTIIGYFDYQKSEPDTPDNPTTSPADIALKQANSTTNNTSPIIPLKNNGINSFISREAFLRIIKKYNPGLVLFMNKTQHVIKGCKVVDPNKVSWLQVCDVDVYFEFPDTQLKVEIFPERNAIKYHAPDVLLKVDLTLILKKFMFELTTGAHAYGTLKWVYIEATPELVDKRTFADQSQQVKIQGLHFKSFSVDFDANDIKLELTNTILKPATWLVDEIKALKGLIVQKLLGIFEDPWELNHLSVDFNNEVKKGYPESTPLDNRQFPGVSVSLIFNENAQIFDSGLLFGIEGIALPTKLKDNTSNFPKNVACESLKDKIEPSEVKTDLQLIIGECLLSSFIDTLVEVDWTVHIKFNNTLMEEASVKFFYWDQMHLKVSENHIHGALAINLDTVIWSKRVNFQMKFYFKAQFTRSQDFQENKNLELAKNDDQMLEGIQINPHIHQKGTMLIFDVKLNIWDIELLKMASEDMLESDMKFLIDMMRQRLLQHDFRLRLRVPNYCMFDETCTKDGEIKLKDGYIQINTEIDV